MPRSIRKEVSYGFRVGCKRGNACLLQYTGYPGKRNFPVEADLLLLICRLLAGLLPGIFLLVLAKITREAVGYGDGLILLFIGLSLGFWECIGIFFIGLLGVFLAAVLVALFFGRKKGLEIPFIPFLLTGLAGGYFWMKG